VTESASPTPPVHQYVVGDVVLLKALNEVGDEDYEPPELGVILTCEEMMLKRDPSDRQMKWEEMYIVEVQPTEPGDDGLRELQVEAIERRATAEETAQFNATYHRTDQARAYLQHAGPYLGITETPE
jgi:hypothetical protein